MEKICGNCKYYISEYCQYIRPPFGYERVNRTFGCNEDFKPKEVVSTDTKEKR